MDLPTHPLESFKKRNPHLYQHQVAQNGFEKKAENLTRAECVIDLNFESRKNTDEGKLNKLERAYLAHLRMLGVPRLRIQQITLKLADDCRFTADFTYVDANGRMVFVDTKGFQREDALLKMKFAARTFTEFRFVIVTKVKGQWEEREVKP